MGDFFAELRRRHIYRIGAVYVVAAWGVAQVVDLLSQIFALPDWIAQPVVIVLAIGFPATLIIAWMIEGKAHEAVASTIRSPATTVDWLLFGAVAAVLVFMGYERLNPVTPVVVATTEQENTATTGIADEIIEAVSDRMPNSVAVLPFENVSPDPDDAYFAVGVHTELLAKLSKLSDVTVIARASVLKYEGSGMSIPDIAEELNVEMVMAGSVRYAGDQVRVTVELIDGETNVPAWTDEYDGDLSDIFGIQAEIAMNIANSLQATYSAVEQEGIETPPTDSPEAYTAYLKAMAVVDDGFYGPDPRRRALIQSYLDEALAIDPDFALAHAWKAFTFVMSGFLEPVAPENRFNFISETTRLARMHNDMALALDPTLGLAHALQAGSYDNEGRSEEARLERELALRLSPNDPWVLTLLARELWGLDQLEEALTIFERIAELSPNVAESHASLGDALLAGGRAQDAREAFQKCLSLEPAAGGCTRTLAWAEFALGNNEEALNGLRRREQISPGVRQIADVAYGYGRLGQAEDARRLFETLREREADVYVSASLWALAHMGVGDYDEALVLFNAAADDRELPPEEQLGQDMQALVGIFGNVWSDPMLEEPEFVEVLERIRASSG